MINSVISRSILQPQRVADSQQILAELARMTKDTKKATETLSPIEKKLYDHYVRNMADHINYVDDKANESVLKKAIEALETYAEHLFDKTPEGKALERAKNKGRITYEQLEILEAKKRYPMLSAIQKVTALFQREVAEARKSLEPLGLKEVTTLSDKVLQLAMKRDGYYAQAEKLVKEAKDISSPTINKYREQEYKRLTHLGNLIEEVRANTALERLEAIKKYRANVEKFGKQKEYELIHGLPFN